MIPISKNANTFPVYFGDSGISAIFINLATGKFVDFVAEEMVTSATPRTGNTLLTVTDKETEAYWIECPDWLPVGVYDVVIFNTTTPTDESPIDGCETIQVVSEAAYNNLHSGTDTQALITGLNTLGSRSLNDLYGSNNQLIP